MIAKCNSSKQQQQQQQLEIWGRAQREAARRRKSDWKGNFGSSNSARSNATRRMNCASLHSTRIVGLGRVNVRAYNFFVCEPKFTNDPTYDELWLINYFSDFRYVDPFRRYSRSKSMVVRNRAEF